MYKYAVCPNYEPIKYKLRIVCVNELAHGDLKMLVKNRELLKDNDTMLNLLMQCIISIGTFQNRIGFVHNDCHYGNFLYQKNNEKGYYEYSFNKKSYYLKSCDYNMMIYDFGLSKPVDIYSRLIPADFTRICKAFMNKTYGWGEYDDLPNHAMNINVYGIISLLHKYNYTNETDYFGNIINTIFSQYISTGIWLTNRPDNVINKTPFYID